MTAGEWAMYVGLAFVGLTLSALYSGLETGLYTLNRVRLTIRAARRDSDAIRLRSQLGHPTRTLSVLLLGTNTSNYLGTWALTGIIHATGISDWSLILLEAIVITPILFVFAETLPKDLFRTHTDRWTYTLSRVITISRGLFTVTGLLPVIHFATVGMTRLLRLRMSSPVTARQRISQLIREGVGVGVLSMSQATLTDRVLSLRERRVSSVMIPWRAVVSLPADASQAARESLVRSRNYSRLPVVDQGRAIGVVAWHDLVVNRETPTRALMQPPMTLAPRIRLIEAISALRQERQTMAIVVDPATHRPLGIITMKDLVEPLTGELTAW